MSEAKNVSPAELRANPWNTNFVSPANEAKLDASLRRAGGLFKPIIVRRVAGVEGYEILGGEHRWGSAQRCKLAEVPIFDLGEIGDERAKEVMLADNARYGADDTLALSELLADMGNIEDLKQFLPYTDADVASIFQSTDIALDDLELIDPAKNSEEIDEPPAPRAPRTHTMMRFKVSNEDAERITELIERTKQDHGLTAEDQATNAGDALVQLLLSDRAE